MQYYIVDSFADEMFQGNQAGVCLMEKWPEDGLMQNIARENNLAETAFVVPGTDGYGLRWFTPEGEIDLCGHATLASGFIIANFIAPQARIVRFHSVSGLLTVERDGQLYELDFPARPPAPVAVHPAMAEAVGARIVEAHLSRDMVLLLENDEVVEAVQPDLVKLGKIPGCANVVITAAGNGVDFVSRFFTPGALIAEDPVTGSAHSTLIPFWSERLEKEEMVARQLSARGGTLLCKNAGDRVKIAGKAVLYLKGELMVSVSG